MQRVTNQQLLVHADVDDVDVDLNQILAPDSINDKMNSWLRDVCGFTYAKDECEFNPLNLHVVYAICTAIWHEYDSDQRLVWDAFDLGGDDDVDYNATHVIAYVDLLRAYCDAHEIVHT